MVIVATKNGNELREMLFTDYDFEVGNEANSFQINVRRSEWEAIPANARIYIPGTEYGGLFRKLETDTARGTISPGGITWRGMLQKKIISPASGADYATDSGELNAIIRRRVNAEFPGLIYGSEESTGVTVSGFQYTRYCTLYDGLRALLASVGYRMQIEYSQTQNGVIVSAVPIVNYASEIEFSSDMRTNYYMQTQSDGVNHLICLGTGELRNRLVYHLYVNRRGKITTTKAFTGVDEITEVYDSPGAELSDLRKGGRERLKELMNKNIFEINVDPDTELMVDDIVGGRDYLSGMNLQAPVIGKIVKWSRGRQLIEYTLDEAGEVN